MAVSSDTQDMLNELQSWRRTSPIAILYFTFSHLKGLLNGAIYMIPALAISFDTIMANKPYWIQGGIAIAILFPLSGLLSYWFYQFRLGEEHVEVKSGIFNKRHIDLPFSRIQNVKLELPLYYRLTMHQIVTLDTAGSKNEEARIVAVPAAYAKSLKEYILAVKAKVDQTHEADLSTHAESNAEATPSQTQSEVVLNRRSIIDLVIHGITNNRVWIILGVAAPMYDSFFSWVAETLGSMGLDIEKMVSENTLAWWQFGLFAISFVMILMLVMALISVGGAVIMFYDYQLSRQGNRYIRRCGLFTKQEVSMRLSRLQLIQSKQDWLDVILGRVNLVFKQNTSGHHQQAQQASLESANSLMVPSVTMKETAALVRDAWPDNGLYSAQFQGVNVRYFIHMVALRIVPPFALLFVTTLFAESWKPTSIVIGVFLVVVGLTFLYWRRLGIAWDDKYIYVRKGMLGVDYSCFPRYKLQQVEVSQSILMARKQLASISFVLASGQVKIPFIAESLAYALANDTLYTTEKSKKSWM